MDADLIKIIHECWDSLDQGSEKADHPFRNMMICSYGEDTISTCTVVLRTVDTKNSQLVFYTDTRSEKVYNLQRDNRLSVLFYDSAAQIQLIVKGNVVIHKQDTICAEHWKVLSEHGKKAYMAQPGPSTKINEPTDGLEYINEFTMPDALLIGYENFTVVIVQVKFMECLKLKREGHRRAGFNLINNNWEGTWLIP